MIRAIALVYMLAASTAHVPGQLFFAPHPEQQSCPSGGCCPQQPPFEQPAIPDSSTAVRLPDNVRQAIVRIANSDRLANQRSLVSGTVIESTESGTLVLTCAHMVDAASSPNFEVYFPNAQRVSATLVEIDAGLDLAALHLPVQGVPVVPLADNPPNQGDRAYFAGYGGQGQLLARSGRTTQYVTFGTSGPQQGAIEVTGGARSGDSGGPIFNESLKLVGVIACSNGAEVMPGARPVSVQVSSATSGPVTMGTCCRHFPGFLKRVRDRIAARRGHRALHRSADVAPQPPGPPALPPSSLQPPTSSLQPPLVEVPPQPPAPNPQPPADAERDSLLERLKQHANELRDRQNLIDKLRGEKSDAGRQIDALSLDKQQLASGLEKLRDKIANLQNQPAVTAAETSLLTKLLVASGFVSPPLAGLAAGAIVFVARRRGKKLRGQLAAGDFTINNRLDRLRPASGAVPANNDIQSPAGAPGRTELKMSRVPTTDHEYNRLLEAMKRVADHEPKYVPVVEMIQSVFDQLTSGEIRDTRKLREGSTLGWRDETKGES